MKKLVLYIAFIAISISTFAQQNESYIDVTGNVEYDKTVEKYIVKTIISQDLDYDNNCESIEELKSNYFKKLGNANFDTKKLKQDQLAYMTFGYKKEGTLLILETKSKDEFMNFLTVNSTGMQIYNRDVVYKLSSKEVTNLAKEAIDNARLKAENIARSVNKKLGDILTIIDHNQHKTKETLYYDSLNDKGVYVTQVRFELL